MKYLNTLDAEMGRFFLICFKSKTIRRRIKKYDELVLTVENEFNLLIITVIVKYEYLNSSVQVGNQEDFDCIPLAVEVLSVSQ